MSLRSIFQQVLDKLLSIEIDNPVTIQNSNNFKKTASNQNKVFKFINNWNKQIDEGIKGNTYVVANPSIFIEIVLGECKMLLNNVSSYPDSKINFHIFTTSLNGQEDLMDIDIDIYDKRDLVKDKLARYSPIGCTMFMCCFDDIDYQHKNVTKYILGYNFCYTDISGSIFSKTSTIYTPVYKIQNPNLGISIFKPWISEYNYTENIDTVSYGFENNGVISVYLCSNSNSDKIFNVNNWIKIPVWISGNKNLVNSYVYYHAIVFMCITENSDTEFNISNWNQITN